jgi:hypothetical protein
MPAPLETPFRPASHSLRHRLGALALVLLTACGGCFKTDAERAAEERAKIEKQIRDSNTLVPYRALKLTLRSQGTGKEPEAVTALWKMVLETQNLPHKDLTPEQTAQVAGAYLKLAITFYKAKQTLREHDEDDFPLLWSKLAEAAPFTGYDAGMEHLLVGALMVVLDTAERGNKLPMSDLALYEFSRATPSPEWPASLRTLSRGCRGLSFMEARYHYAAEEELTAYLAEVEEVPESELEPLLLHTWETTPAQERESLRALGHFLRAWNRMQLKRDDPAAEDVEKGLAALERLGIENELTWWGWSFVHFKRARYPESAKNMEKLANSPYVDEPTRKELLASAGELRTHGESLPLFQQQRAAIILGQALVARAGGLEKILVTVLGKERAKQVYEPILWMDRVRTGVAQVKTEDVVREAGGVMDKAREAGNKGLSTLKDKLLGGDEKGTGASAGSGPR